MGGVVFSLPVAEVVAARVMEAEAVPSLPGAVSRGLSAREIQVVQLIGRGYADAEIALELSISPRTVQHYVANAMNKLGARSRSEVVARVIGGAPPLARVR
jgi:DNA-binding NarL/FixJ family response regulator